MVLHNRPESHNVACFAMAAQKRLRSIADYFPLQAELPLAEKDQEMSASFCVLLMNSFSSGYSNQVIKLSQKCVIFLWLKNIALGFRMHRKTHLCNLRILKTSCLPNTLPPYGAKPICPLLQFICHKSTRFC